VKVYSDRVSEVPQWITLTEDCGQSTSKTAQAFARRAKDHVRQSRMKAELRHRIAVGSGLPGVVDRVQLTE
jgi:hypothetical protein